MPLYEYQCQQCHDRVEMIQKFTDPPYEHCPKCGGEMKKLLSSPAIQFKGAGFYKTDYASGAGSSKTDSKPETKSESKAESKSDAKPEAGPSSAKKTE